MAWICKTGEVKPYVAASLDKVPETTTEIFGPLSHTRAETLVANCTPVAYVPIEDETAEAVARFVKDEAAGAFVRFVTAGGWCL